MRALAIDVGTTSVRTALVDAHGTVTHAHQRPLRVRTPQPGEVELDAGEIARVSIELAGRTLREGGPCDAVGVTNQRATTIVFDAASGEPVGPALGWQDLRTVIDCLVLQGEGLRLAPNQSATKARWLVQAAGAGRDLRVATVETWIAWHLSGGALFASDHSNAAVTGLVDASATDWDEGVLEHLGLAREMMPSIVDTMGSHGVASVLAGSPPITALVGDQSASLFGQGCVESGAKITFGTGAMFDMVQGPQSPGRLTRLDSGCFPIVARSRAGALTWGVEGIVLSAGACLEWLRDDWGLVDEVGLCDDIARSVASSDGVSFVPALSGLGTPRWDFGARGGFFGLTRGSTRAHLVRAVLEGIAQRGADLVEAAERETGVALEEIRVDGGLTRSGLLLQHLADVTGARVARSNELEATARGAGLMALVAAGHLDLTAVPDVWRPAEVITPRLDEDARRSSRAAWEATVERVAGTIPELSAVAF